METEEERQARRRMRIEEMKREKRRVEMLRKCIGISMAAMAGLTGCFLGLKGASLLNHASPEVSHETIPAKDSPYKGADILSGEVVWKVKHADGGMYLKADSSGEGRGLAVSGELPKAEGMTHGMGGAGEDGNPFQAEDEMPEKDGIPEKDGTSGEECISDIQAPEIMGNAADGQAPGMGGHESAGSDMGADGAAPDENGAGDDALLAGGAAISGQKALFEAHATEETTGFASEIASEYGIMIDVDEGVILAGKGAKERMVPASMTKILTVLVAAEHLTEEQLQETVSITIDITDYCYFNDCSVTGYGLGEAVTIEDLFYGTILPSGADSALALAIYVAGSQEAFVELMNEKLAELGLDETSHFTNCVGIYHENHYSTAYDIAVILKAAVDNKFVRDVLSEHIYTTSSTEQHPDGLRVSNMFLRRIEDVDTHGEVLCAKTGYVGQSGNCAASFSLGNDGKEYLCVTAGASSSKECIADHAELYRTFIP